VRLEKRQGNFLIDAAFVSGETGITALFGCSGAGKTSVVSMIAGLLRPDRGHVIVNERCLFDSDKGINVAPDKRRIGYVFQDGRLFPHFSVRSNLTYGMRLTPALSRFVEFDQVVELLGIGHLLNRRPAKLSGGEKQRVAIGRSLLTSPSLLLMDEPLASVDGARKAEVLPFVARLSGDLSIPILYVSHSLEEILNLAGSIVILDSGRVVAAGRIEDLMSRLDLEPFLGRSEYGAVINTVVDSHEDSLTRLRFPGGILRVPRFDLPEAAKVRVRIRARDVAISLARPRETSIRNIFSGVVEEIAEGSSPLADVRLNIGCPLLASITRNARTALDLKRGQRVFALVKSVAVSTGKWE
jgi:molybdate transport system ATP-binding protein